MCMNSVLFVLCIACSLLHHAARAGGDLGGFKPVEMTLCRLTLMTYQ